MKAIKIKMDRLPEIIRSERLKTGISQTKLARMAKVHRNTLVNLERRLSPVKVSVIDRIARVLKIRMNVMIGFGS